MSAQNRVKQPKRPNLKVGRYVISEKIASGGMASVHLGRLSGPVGFSRTVAIKRLHPTYAKDPEFVAMFLDEARLVARVRHPNVVPIVDVVAENGELFLVMEYVEGDNLARLTRAEPIGIEIAAGIMINVLRGLHAAHSARALGGEPLEIVHRDVSPQNILVDIDGIARVTDFGIAKASEKIYQTRYGEVKGKYRYMASEQISPGNVDCRTDVYACGVVLWELLTAKKLIATNDLLQARGQILGLHAKPPGLLNPEVSPELDAIVLRALSRKPEDRFATAAEMANALENATRPAMPTAIGSWVRAQAGDALEQREHVISELEASVVKLTERAIASRLSALTSTPDVEAPAGDSEWTAETEFATTASTSNCTRDGEATQVRTLAPVAPGSEFDKSTPANRKQRGDSAEVETIEPTTPFRAEVVPSAYQPKHLPNPQDNHPSPQTGGVLRHAIIGSLVGLGVAVLGLFWLLGVKHSQNNKAKPQPSSVATQQASSKAITKHSKTPAPAPKPPITTTPSASVTQQETQPPPSTPQPLPPSTKPRRSKRAIPPSTKPKQAPDFGSFTRN